MSSSSSQNKQQQQKKSKLKRYVLAPFRGLAWVRDFYVRKIMSCADRSQYVDAVYPGTAMPRSQSVRSTADDDLRELVRAVSQRDYRHLNLDGKLTSTPATIETVPRSQSVAVGRIDEDKPLEFDGDVKLGPLYPRSRSTAPMRKQMMPF